MKALERLAPEDLMKALVCYRDLLKSHQDRLNRLNVYPVPDGDTGTNLALTVESVVEEIESGVARAGERTTSMSEVIKAMSHGSLMGARGNSGVILSQILRGFGKAVGGNDTIDGPAMVLALREASDGAYQAVQRPVEGTILTVVRSSAEAVEAMDGKPRLDVVLDAAWTAASKALESTPDLLPALKSAGVVDAGGAGFLLLLNAMLNVVEERPLPEAGEPRPRGSRDGEARTHTGSPPGLESMSADKSGPRYEVMYMLEAPDESIPSFRQVLAGLGDSIVVVGGDGTWNAHVHSDEVGGAIEAALDAGRPRDIRVTDLWEQVEEERWVREAAATSTDEPEGAPVECAVVAVCSGEGVRRIFRSLGVNVTVTGGQSMNPSTAELVEAVEAAPAKEVVILPNNKNIIAVAEQARLRSEKTVTVVPTRGIPEGFAALLEYDPEGQAEDNAKLMALSASRIIAGEVTTAVRDGSSDAGPVRHGDYLGLDRSGIVVVASGLAEAAIGLLQSLIDSRHHEIVTIIAGEGSRPADTRAVTEWLAESHPKIATEVHHGGQPLYPYLVSVE